MRFKVFKNTVLFPIFIGIVLVTIACTSKTKNEVASNDEILKQEQESEPIIVGANQIETYLPLFEGKRIGIVANQTSVIFKKIATTSEESRNDSSFTHLVDSLLKHKVDIKKVFAPEHGFRGKADAGEDVKDGIDTKTKLPILSLHGKHKKPTKEQLENLDFMVFDIQDVGVRFYTYISTLHYVMEACAENNVPLLILDRPNPNGNYVDGPVLEKKHSSFLGMHPIPLVHGMTIGEYAQMINGEGWLKNGVTCDITIIEMKNYNHHITYSLPIRPSPNLPNDQAITLYPSLGLFEGTNINAGRGTEFQFQRYGAPFLDKNHYKFSYTPVSNFGAKYPKHQNTICYGVDLSNINAEREFSLKYIIDAYKNATDKSKVFMTSNFTKHAGTEKLQRQIESGISETEIKAGWKKDLNTYKNMRKKYLIYD
ncbi:DUF1343 domain-containing protein [Winogradskyella sp.]|uniref:exo-beta-N-acetylmuramidase NamZ family protein n=1 Tax=Winogradskyella sp. TaxID=1883156 RepID=UPI0026087561|nr:DUF1343 domain-containing protein [Winogradskyella sp.]